MNQKLRRKEFFYSTVIENQPAFPDQIENKKNAKEN
jgi:hypothetical protein